MPANHAAYLVEAKSFPLEIREAPYPSPEPNTVTYAVLPLKYPLILGSDAAGEVVEVGRGVTNVTKSQRIIGYCAGTGTGDSRYSGFQEYTIIPANALAPIPASLSYEQGAVLPLALCTAAAGLYQEDHLNISPRPSRRNNLEVQF
ncbi:CipB protein [Cadophora sp. DSE1049]|nr:CipB protein [Cadophora sp. DSE1049]